MTRVLAVLRPEPGNAATCARAAAAGFATLSLPLFSVRALAWTPPDAAEHDALLLTSANVLRFAGAALDAMKRLPVLAVGPHTAAAARAAGFDVMASGSGDGADIARLAATRGVVRALHLTGRDRTLAVGGAITAVRAVYESVALPIGHAALGELVATTALLHSARAAHRLDTLLREGRIDRRGIALGTFSQSIAAAAGLGWAGIATAAAPNDAALFAAIRASSETTSN